MLCLAFLDVHHVIAPNISDTKDNILDKSRTPRSSIERTDRVRVSLAEIETGTLDGAKDARVRRSSYTGDQSRGFEPSLNTIATRGLTILLLRVALVAKLIIEHTCTGMWSMLNV